MNPEYYKYQECLISFWRDYSRFLHSQTAVPLEEYFKCCGYKRFNHDLICSNNNLLFEKEILNRYADYHVFTQTIPRDGIVNEIVFNLRDHLHIFALVVNVPEEGGKDPRFVIAPVIYSDKIEKVLKFYDDNNDLRIKPVLPKTVGFSALV